MKTLLLLFALCCLFPVFSLIAQENVLAYGESLTGEITNKAYEVEYTFQGTAGDLPLIQVIPDDAFDGLSQPAITLLDADANVLGTIDASLSEATLIYELPADGEYHVIVSRTDGREGESVGEYTITLNQVTPLALGETIEGNITSSASLFYAINVASDADLQYTKTSGDFTPMLSLNTIGGDFLYNTNLTSVIEIDGAGLKRSSFGIPESDTLYILNITEALFDFNFSEVTANFVLQLVEAE